MISKCTFKGAHFALSPPQRHLRGVSVFLVPSTMVDYFQVTVTRMLLAKADPYTSNMIYHLQVTPYWYILNVLEAPCPFLDCLPTWSRLFQEPTKGAQGNWSKGPFTRTSQICWCGRDVALGWCMIGMIRYPSNPSSWAFGWHTHQTSDGSTGHVYFANNTWELAAGRFSRVVPVWLFQWFRSLAYLSSTKSWPQMWRAGKWQTCGQKLKKVSKKGARILAFWFSPPFEKHAIFHSSALVAYFIKDETLEVWRRIGRSCGCKGLFIVPVPRFPTFRYGFGQLTCLFGKLGMFISFETKIT